MKMDGTRLSMIRGDTETLLVTCEDATGAARPFEEGDTVHLTVGLENGIRKILQKTVTVFQDGGAVFHFGHEDTNGIPPARYRYDVQLTTRDGAVKTIIPPGDFILEGDVTRE